MDSRNSKRSLAMAEWGMLEIRTVGMSREPIDMGKRRKGCDAASVHCTISEPNTNASR